MTKQNIIFWYDVETTGLKADRNGIHQMGIIIEKDYEVVEKANIKMKVLPSKQVDEGAFTFCGLTSAIMDNYQSAEDGFKQLMDILKKYEDCNIFKAGFNNIWFDDKFLEQLFIDHGEEDFYNKVFDPRSLDVYRKYKALPYSQKENTPNEKLETLANHFNIEIKAHDGLSDIEATRAVYYKVFKKDKEMHDIEYRDDHQQYHEEVVLKEELEKIDTEINEDFEDSVPQEEEFESLSEIGEVKPTMALTVKTMGQVELHENANDYEEHIDTFLTQVKPENMKIAKDFEIGNQLVKELKAQRDHIKVGLMALDNKEIAEIRSTLLRIDGKLQKAQSAFERAIKEHKAKSKEEFFENAFKEITDSDKFGLEYDNFKNMLSEKVKGMRSQENMNAAADELIVEINTKILVQTQRYLEISKVVKDTFAFNSEQCTENMIEKYSDEYLEKCYDDETIKLFLEKEIGTLQKGRQDKLKAEIDSENTAASKAHAMDHKTPSFVFNVNARVVMKASCISEAKFMLEKDLSKINGRVDTLDITTEE